MDLGVCQSRISLIIVLITVVAKNNTKTCSELADSKMIGHCAYNVKPTIANKSVVQQKHQIRKANSNLQTGNYFFPQKIKKKLVTLANFTIFHILLGGDFFSLDTLDV